MSPTHRRWLPLAAAALLVLLLGTPGWTQQDLILRAEVVDGVSEAPFGTPVPVRVSLRWDANREGFTPPPAENIELPQAHLLDRFSVSPRVLDVGQEGVDYHLVITRFEPGEVELGPVELTVFGKRLSSAVLPFHFTGAAPREGDQPDQVRPPHSAQTLSTRDFWTRLAKWAGGLLGFILVALALERKLRLWDRFLSPRRQTLRKLRRLEHELRGPEADPKAILLELDGLFRRYLVRAEAVSATSATGSELSRMLKASELPPEWGRFSEDLVHSTDPVKFARGSVAAETAQGLLTRLTSLLEARSSR